MGRAPFLVWLLPLVFYWSAHASFTSPSLPASASCLCWLVLWEPWSCWDGVLELLFSMEWLPVWQQAFHCFSASSSSLPNLVLSCASRLHSVGSLPTLDS